MFVDGYNVIGLWFCIWEVCNFYGLEIVRRNLIEVLVNYSVSEDLNI